jgi:hypothetical protein
VFRSIQDVGTHDLSQAGPGGAHRGSHQVQILTPRLRVNVVMSKKFFVDNWQSVGNFGFIYCYMLKIIKTGVSNCHFHCKV